MNELQTQMKSLRLHGMDKCWQALIETKKHLDLTLSEGLLMLLQAEELQRSERRYERLRFQAKFRYQASMTEVFDDPQRGLSKEMLVNLKQGNYLKDGQAILITGATGCGKSFLASALGHDACEKGAKVLYFNTQKLMIKTKHARAEGSILKLFEKIAKTDLLILDDFGLATLSSQQRADFMEIIEDRHAKKSTIMVSQLPVSNWYDLIGDSTIADAILDRLVHTSIRVELKGESLRKKL